MDYTLNADAAQKRPLVPEHVVEPAVLLMQADRVLSRQS